MRPETVRIAVFGTERDVDLQVSRRGLFRTSPIRRYRDRDGSVSCACEVRCSAWTHRKLRVWFDEGNVSSDPRYVPTTRKIDMSPGRLASISSS